MYVGCVHKKKKKKRREVKYNQLIYKHIYIEGKNKISYPIQLFTFEKPQLFPNSIGRELCKACVDQKDQSRLKLLSSSIPQAEVCE